MHTPDVTFVVPTHERPHALWCTLQSLILQDHQEWTALVIGDCCGQETTNIIRLLRDPRIKYYNLPQRCGESSELNNFGLHLASDDYIAFLSPDDMLLRDHLIEAMRCLTWRRDDFFIGRFASIAGFKAMESGDFVPIATNILPANEDLSSLVRLDLHLFDPSSSWIVRTSFAKAVGPWQPARTLWRTPLRDWLMRAWRKGGGFCFGKQVTGAHFSTPEVRADAPIYQKTTPEHEHMLTLLQSESSDTIRQLFLQHVQQCCKGGNVGVKPKSHVETHFRSGLHKCLASLYRNFGIDHVDLWGHVFKQPRVPAPNDPSPKRDEALPQVSDMQAIISDPEVCRVL